MNWTPGSQVGRSKKADQAMVCVEGRAATYLKPGTSFNKIPELASKAGFSKFRVWIDGKEIDPSDAPAEVTAGMQIEVRRDDNVAG